MEETGDCTSGVALGRSQQLKKELSWGPRVTIAFQEKQMVPWSTLGNEVLRQLGAPGRADVTEEQTRSLGASGKREGKMPAASGHPRLLGTSVPEAPVIRAH